MDMDFLGLVLVVMAIGAIAVLVFSAWIWLVYDCATSRFITIGDRQIWLLLLVGSWLFGLGWLVGIVYFATRPARKAAFLEQQGLEEEDRRPRRRSRRRRPAYDD